MGLRLRAAKGISAITTWGLRSIFKRPAANLPGKLALYVDPQLIKDLSTKLKKGSMIVCGTNGKTTVTNLVADVLEQENIPVICNRTGANLDSGIATALLHGDSADWGVFESDELWLAKVLPHLKSDYLVLLNLFRDQLDRVGEIDVIQDSIVSALKSSPDTTLVYNADDPLCAAIAVQVPHKKIAFGIDGPLGLEQNTVVDAQMCQQCSGMLEYTYRQYGQLGEYHCTNCDFSRQNLDYAAQEVSLDSSGLSFKVAGPSHETALIKAPYQGAYMVYNLLASFVSAQLLGCSAEGFQRALDQFDPQNGRLQKFDIDGRSVLLNLAKNPTGFNQNLSLILADEGPKVVAFYVNDKEGDGRDVSWLWDIDFEDLATQEGLKLFAGGIRKNDLQLRLKYAGLDAHLVEGAAEVMADTEDLPSGYRWYLIANYTALPPIREELTGLAQATTGGVS